MAAHEKETLVVQFLVPIYDRRGRPYPRAVQKRLRKDLEDRFDGWSLAADRPLTGAWRNPASGEIEHDDAWRYEVGIPPARLPDFDAFLADLAHRLGQKAIWRVIYAGGEGKVVLARHPGT